MGYDFKQMGAAVDKLLKAPKTEKVVYEKDIQDYKQTLGEYCDTLKEYQKRLEQYDAEKSDILIAATEDNENQAEIIELQFQKLLNQQEELASQQTELADKQTELVAQQTKILEQQDKITDKIRKIDNTIIEPIKKNFTANREATVEKLNEVQTTVENNNKTLKTLLFVSMFMNVLCVVGICLLIAAIGLY